MTKGEEGGSTRTGETMKPKLGRDGSPRNLIKVCDV